MATSTVGNEPFSRIVESRRPQPDAKAGAQSEPGTQAASKQEATQR